MSNVFIRLLQSVTPANHDSICDAIKENLDEHLFCTLEYEGRLCTTDGSQFIELIQPENGFGPDVSPTIIPIPEDGGNVKVIDTSLNGCLHNIALVIGTTGAPLSELALFLRLVLINHGRNILNDSQALREGGQLILTDIQTLDTNQAWLVNACLWHCSQQTGQDRDTVTEAFLMMDKHQQIEFIKATSVAMGFRVEEK